MKISKLLLLTSIMVLSSISVYSQLEWVEYTGEVPSNAIIGGVETHRSLVVCRSSYKRAMHPGKVVAGACNIGWGGKEIVLKDFEILVNKGVVELEWLKSNGSIPDNAVQAGNEKGKPLYVGRAFHENGTHPGKVFKARKDYICNIGWGGKEITSNSFEVLVENEIDPYLEKLEHDSRCNVGKKVKHTAVRYIGTMGKERMIKEGESLISSNLKYQTRVTNDGRLVVEEVTDKALRDQGKILVFQANEIWSNTKKGGDASLDYYLKFQEDSNLCIYSEQYGFVWCSMSNGLNGHHFELNNLGHLEVVNDHGGEVWPD